MQFDRIAFCSLFAEPQKNGLTRPKAVRGSGLPMVNMGELFAHRRIRHMKMDRVVVKPSESAYILCPGDLLFARQSLVLSGAGKCSLFEACVEPTVFESHLIRSRLDRTKADSRFYFYFFESPQGRAAMESIVEQGAGQSGIRASDLARLLVPHPPAGYQSGIAELLSSLDDRIDSLRAISMQLETVAHTIFKSWFVDFDPVSAKAEGREPEGMDVATAALFPSSLVDHGGLEVPSGWHVHQLKDVCDIGSGKRPTSRVDQKSDGNEVPLYGGAGQMGYTSGRLAAGDSILTGRVGTLGLVWLVKPPFWASDNTLVLRPKAGIDLPFIYLSVKNMDIRRLNRGSTQPLLTQGDLGKQLIVLPSEELRVAFHVFASNLLDKIRLGVAMSETLIELRDTLLPRLISGKLRIPEAEKLLASAL